VVVVIICGVVMVVGEVRRLGEPKRVKSKEFRRRHSASEKRK
jgi:hypothetical protein